MGDWREQQRHRDRVRRDEVMSLPALRIRHHSVIGGSDGDVLVRASVGPRPARWWRCGRRQRAWVVSVRYRSATGWRWPARCRSPRPERDSAEAAAVGRDSRVVMPFSLLKWVGRKVSEAIATAMTETTAEM